MKTDDQYIARLKELFFIQTDYYAEQFFSRNTGKAGYSPACDKKHSATCKANNYDCNACSIRQLSQLTDETLRKHLAGKITVGAYQVKNDLVKWLCLDFDVAEDVHRPTALEMARQAWGHLDHMGIAAYIEDSGNKGYHLWVFFSHEVKASLARELGQRLLHKLEEEQEWPGVDVEVFPKQERADGFGNLVKVPLGVHRKTRRRCLFIRPDGSIIPDQDEFLLNIQTINDAFLPELLAEFEPATSGDKSGKQKIIPDVIPQGKRDVLLTSIAGTMRARGMTAEEIEVALRAINQQRCQPPLEDKEIVKIARSISRYEPSSSLAEEQTAHYRFENGGIVYMKPYPAYVRGTGHVTGWQTIPVSNFSIGIAAELRSCDGEETQNMFSLCGQTADRHFYFDISAEDATDPRKLHAALLVHGGGKAIIYAGQIKHVLPAIQSLSSGYQQEIRYVSTGWQKIDDRWIFVTPGGAVGVDLVRCDIAPELRNYRISDNEADLSTGLRAIDFLLNSFDHTITYPAVAHAFLAPMLRFLPNVKRYCLHLTGETGSLKTTLATMLLCLFGNFSNEDPTTKFGSTINSIEALGHQAKDVLFVVDDFKSRYVRLEEFTRLVQNYSDGHGRSRMNRDASLKATKWIRGVLLTTGEDVPEHEASVIARMLILKMSRWDGKNENLAQAQALSAAMPAAMGMFIAWLLRQDLSGIESQINRKRDEFLAILSGQMITNAGRIATNAAQNWLAFRHLATWLHELGQWPDVETRLQEHEDILLSLCGEMARRIGEEKASTSFVESIRALIESGKMALLPRLSSTSLSPGQELLGWQDNEGVYMQANIAFHAAERWLRQIGKSIGFNANAVWDQLEADGLLLNRRKTIRTGEGGLTRKTVLHFSPELLECAEDEDLGF